MIMCVRQRVRNKFEKVLTFGKVRKSALALFRMYWYWIKTGGKNGISISVLLYAFVLIRNQSKT